MIFDATGVQKRLNILYRSNADAKTSRRLLHSLCTRRVQYATMRRRRRRRTKRNERFEVNEMPLHPVRIQMIVRAVALSAKDVWQVCDLAMASLVIAITLARSHREKMCEHNKNKPKKMKNISNWAKERSSGEATATTESTFSRALTSTI